MIGICAALLTLLGLFSWALVFLKSVYSTPVDHGIAAVTSTPEITIYDTCSKIDRTTLRDGGSTLIALDSKSDSLCAINLQNMEWEKVNSVPAAPAQSPTSTR